jgi:hypothetical protein
MLTATIIVMLFGVGAIVFLREDAAPTPALSPAVISGDCSAEFEVARGIQCVSDADGNQIGYASGLIDQVEPTKFVIIDFGGPGASSEVVSNQLAAIRSSEVYADEAVLLALSEFWHQHGLSEMCRTSTQDSLNAVRAGRRFEEGWARSCSSEFDNHRIHQLAQRDFIASLPAEAEVEVLAWSYGFRRSATLLHLSERSVERFIAVVPAMSRSLGQEISARADRIANFTGCIEDDCGNQLRESLPASIEERSVTLTATDFAAAVYGLAYDPQGNSEVLRSLLSTDSTELGRSEALSVVGRSSDSVFQRFGVDSYADAMSGYLIISCAESTEPSDESKPFRTRSENIIADFLFRLHSGCPIERDGLGVSIGNARPVVDSSRICVVKGTDDLIGSTLEDLGVEPALVRHMDGGHFVSLSSTESSGVFDDC